MVEVGNLHRNRVPANDKTDLVSADTRTTDFDWQHRALRLRNPLRYRKILCAERYPT